MNWHEKARFGLHFDLHATGSETGHGRGLESSELGALLDAVRPDFVQCDCKGHPGFTTWPTSFGNAAPELAKDSLMIYREETSSRNIPLIVHYSGVLDERACEAHPEWAVVGPDGLPHDGVTSYFGGYDTELLIPQLLEIVDNYAVDGVWVDGECWAARPDWSSESIAQFRRETGFTGTIPRTPTDLGWSLWMTFNRNAFRAHVSRYRAAVKERHPNVTVVSNWQFTTRMPDVVGADVDYVSGDVSQAFGVAEALPEAVLLDTRGVSWDLMLWAFGNGNGRGGWAWTAKQPEHLAQEASVILSRDGVVAVYDLHPRDGSFVAWHTPILAELSKFVRARHSIPVGRSLADALILLSPEEHWRQLNNAYEYTPPQGYVSPTEHDELFVSSHATDRVRGACFALQELHVPYDLATFEDNIDLSTYDTIVIPEQGDLTFLEDALSEFVEQGGHLVVTGVGLAATEPSIKPAWLWVGSSAGRTAPVMANVGSSLTGSEVLHRASSSDANLEDLALSGQVVTTRRSVGRGRITESSLLLFESFNEIRSPQLRDIIGDVMRPYSTSISTDAPSWIWMSRRRSDDCEIIHLVNMNSGVPGTPRSPFVDEIPVAPDFWIRIRRDLAPADVTMLPTGLTPQWSHSDGILEVRVPGFHIHEALVVRD